MAGRGRSSLWVIIMSNNNHIKSLFTHLDNEAGTFHEHIRVWCVYQQDGALRRHKDRKKRFAQVGIELLSGREIAHPQCDRKRLGGVAMSIPTSYVPTLLRKLSKFR